MPQFWTCTATECSSAAAIDIGVCGQCSGHFCTEHVISPEHTCKAEIDDAAWQHMLYRELDNLRQRVNIENLLKHASQANQGQSCSLESPDDFSTCPLGGMHIHLRINFANSTSWFARVPRINAASFSDDLTNRILLNECATLKWLERVDIPTPRLHGYALIGDANNDVGVAYMLIDEMPGKPFNQYRATAEQSRKVLYQWSSFMNTLSHHQFEAIGSLTINTSGTIEIGPIVGDRTGVLDRLGPFRTGQDFYIALLNEYLLLVASKQVLGRFSVDAYLMIWYMQSLVKRSKHNAATATYDDGPFYLKHTDDKGDHLLVDDNWNICGVIDWSFARVVPAYEAFGLSLLTADMGDIFAGRPGRSINDKFLAQCSEARGGLPAQFAHADDRIRRFQFGIGVGMDVTWSEAVNLFTGILATVGEVDTFPPWEQWREEQLEELTKSDETLNMLSAQHK